MLCRSRFCGQTCLSLGNEIKLAIWDTGNVLHFCDFKVFNFLTLQNACSIEKMLMVLSYGLPNMFSQIHAVRCNEISPVSPTWQ